MTETTSRQTIEGPITGGDHGWPFGPPLFDLGERGYVAEEFFLSGEATTYREAPDSDWGRDGSWRAEPTRSVPFTTRLLVYRPADPQRFNGTVVVSWNNVTAGYELFGGESPEFFEGGYTVVLATVQRVGVEGFPTDSQGLAAWDPTRVGLRGTNLIREDLDVPVMVVNSELEAMACYDVRQPDTDRFRYWESAGTCHVSIQAMDVRAPKYEREFGTHLPVMRQMNRIAITPLYDAALHHLARSVAGGAAPPVQPLIDFTGEPAVIVRDGHGIATGGVRLPQADVPVAQNSAIPLGKDVYSMLWGSSHPFDTAELDAMYGDEEIYIERFSEAARSAVAAGVVLPRDVDPLVDEARREFRRAHDSTT